MKKIKILVACHKPSVVRSDDVYTPIHVGRAISKCKETMADMMIGDDTGDHISEKNPNYCELTGVYWAWKNLKDVDFIGLCHYRRFFDFQLQFGSTLPSYHILESQLASVDFSIPKRIENSLEQGFVVVAKRVTMPVDVRSQFCSVHISSDLLLLEKYIRENEEFKYSKAFSDLMFSHSECLYNMFVMPRAIFEDYCTWLFRILFSIEEEIDTSTYSDYNKRVFGFMGERLLNVYLRANQFKCLELPVIFASNNTNNMKIWKYHKNVLINKSIEFLCKHTRITW